MSGISIAYILMKILDKIPRKLLVFLGYSKIGSSVIKQIRKKESSEGYELENGIKMYLDLANPLTWELIQKKDPEKRVKDIFLDNFNQGDTVIDVGANIGEYSLIAAKKVSSDGKVISLEPLNDASKWLKKNLILNDFHNCVVLEKAVGSKPGKMTLYKKSSSGNIGFLEPTVGGKKLVNTSEIIEVETIDDILAAMKIERVGMLKIDVEGFEYDVLLGCKKSFKENKINKIICEIHINYLRKKGFNENKIYSLLKENRFSVKFIEKLDSKGTIHVLASHLQDT